MPLHVHYRSIKTPERGTRTAGNGAMEPPTPWLWDGHDEASPSPRQHRHANCATMPSWHNSTYDNSPEDCFHADTLASHACCQLSPIRLRGGGSAAGTFSQAPAVEMPPTPANSYNAANMASMDSLLGCLAPIRAPRAVPMDTCMTPRASDAAAAGRRTLASFEAAVQRMGCHAAAELQNAAPL